MTFRAGDPERPRGHALVFFRDGESPDDLWATYLVVTPIKMDLGKYIPAAFASQLAGQLSAACPSAYPLPPVPEKFEGGLTALEHLADLRNESCIRYELPADRRALDEMEEDIMSQSLLEKAGLERPRHDREPPKKGKGFDPADFLLADD